MHIDYNDNMVLTDRQKIYVEMNMSKNLTSKDIESVFSKEELDQFTLDFDLLKYIGEQKIELELTKLNEKRKKAAMNILAYDCFEELMPHAKESMMQILNDVNNINYMAVLRILLSGKAEYMKKYAENIADSDCPPKVDGSPGNGGLNPYKLNYNLDNPIDE